MDSTFLGALAALGAATAWSFSGILSHSTAKNLGGFGFNRLRLLLAGSVLLVLTSVLGQWQYIGWQPFTLLIISGFIGIFIGDSALFSTLARLGPRRTQLIYSTHAPITVILGFLFLNQSITGADLFGCILVFLGIWVAIFFGKPKTELHNFEQITGKLWVGMLIGLIAALCQAVGVIFSSPVMQSGAVNPLLATTLRLVTAALCAQALGLIPLKIIAFKAPVTKKNILIAALSGLLGLGLGMGLYMQGLRYAPAGLVAVLSAITPVLMLPMLWVFMQKVPAPQSWIGALLVVGGTVMIIMPQ